MKKILILGLILITGCTSSLENEVTKPFEQVEKIDEKTEKVLNDEFIDSIFSKMSLEEKISQMGIIYNYSTSYSGTLKNDIVNYQPGGFIVFTENAVSYNQLSNMIASMQKDSKIPMLISVDQEGGRVQRLRYLSDLSYTIIPSMQEVGKKNDADLAYKVGTIIGSELNAIGINMNFAPVMDINSNPYNTVIKDRAFGNNANLVSNMGINLADGLLSENVIPVYKHFPGHGDTSADSHYFLPALNKTKEELEKNEIIPFKNAIKNNAKVIMVGHIAIPKIDGNTPASLSHTMITDILRQEYNFEGVVITDAINMGAITNNYSEKETIIKAINAGVDIILMPSSISNMIKYVKDGISEKKLSEERIDESVKRILKLKYENNLFLENIYQSKNIIGSSKHQNIIKALK